VNGHFSVVLDASALLAFLRAEPGAILVQQALPGAAISSVNWAEVLQRAQAEHIATAGLYEEMTGLGLAIHPFSVEDATLTASLHPQTRQAGLSLADRACVALATRLTLPVLTADRIWATLDLGITVRLLR